MASPFCSNGGAAFLLSAEVVRSPLLEQTDILFHPFRATGEFASWVPSSDSLTELKFGSYLAAFRYHGPGIGSRRETGPRPRVQANEKCPSHFSSLKKTCIQTSRPKVQATQILATNGVPGLLAFSNADLGRIQRGYSESANHFQTLCILSQCGRAMTVMP